MQHSVINLRDYYPNNLDHDLFLTCCLYDKSREMPNKRKNVLVLPGGGYVFTSYRERDPIMFAFLAKGYNAYGLDYSCNKAYPVPYIDVACAMMYIATHSEDQNIIVIGFSAGGHLASTYGYIYKDLAENAKEKKLLKPYALILGYPVISLYNNNKNPNTKGRITNNDKKLAKLLSAELHVTKDYPPTFIFTTKTDQCVDYHHSVLLRDSLIKQKVKNKCIIYRCGPHGLALANEATSANDKNLINKEVSHWVDEAHEFIKSIKEK